jgi:glutamine amidotransferase
VPHTALAIAVLDLGSDDVEMLVSALKAAGATVTVTADRDAVMNADGLIVTGDTDFAAAMSRLRETRGDEVIERRLSGGRPVLGVGVGMHILFDGHSHGGLTTDGLGQWPGTVVEISSGELPARLSVQSPEASTLFAGLGGHEFLFNSPLAATEWTLEVYGAFQPPVVSYATNGERFIAAVENGPLSAVEFHPERSGDAGLQLLRNWRGTLTPRKTT